MKVSLLIGSRNRLNILQRYLDMSLAQDYEDKEILILDDHSDEPYQQQLDASLRNHATIRWLRSERPLGVAGGRNLLMQQASGDIFCFLDDDAQFADEGCISRMVATFERYPRAGIIATCLIDHAPGCTTLLLPFSKYWLKKYPALANQEQLVSYYKGGCHMIHRRVIEQCGGYHNTTLYGEEEVEFSYRVLDTGFEIVYLPDIKVHHYPQRSVVPKQRKQRDAELYHHIRNRFFIAYTYLPMLYIPSYLGFWLSFYGLRAVRGRAWKDYLQGIAHSIAILGSRQRRPLGKQTIAYLKAHYGRLWY